MTKRREVSQVDLVCFALHYIVCLIGLFSGTLSISSQMTQRRIILLFQAITKLYSFTIELKLRDDFRCLRSKMCFRTSSTVPLKSLHAQNGACRLILIGICSGLGIALNCRVINATVLTKQLKLF